jgi:large subunit ribosomal protein L35
MAKMKIKSHKGAAKRFKKTGTGQFTRAAGFKRHILTGKPTKRKRKARGTVVVADADQAKLARMLPYA